MSNDVARRSNMRQPFLVVEMALCINSYIHLLDRLSFNLVPIKEVWKPISVHSRHPQTPRRQTHQGVQSASRMHLHISSMRHQVGVESHSVKIVAVGSMYGIYTNQGVIVHGSFISR